MYIGITLVIIRNIYQVAEFAEGSMTSGTLNEKDIYVLPADGSAVIHLGFSNEQEVRVSLVILEKDAILLSIKIFKRTCAN